MHRGDAHVHLRWHIWRDERTNCGSQFSWHRRSDCQFDSRLLTGASQYSVFSLFGMSESKQFVFYFSQDFESVSLCSTTGLQLFSFIHISTAEAVGIVKSPCKRCYLAGSWGYLRSRYLNSLLCFMNWHFISNNYLSCPHKCVFPEYS